MKFLTKFRIVVDYKAAYFRLFGEVATATEELQAGQHQKALSRLILAQRNAEEMFMRAGEANTLPFPPQKKPPRGHGDPER